MAPVASTMRPLSARSGQQDLRARVAMFMRPAMRAYMVGYLLDALPTLFKQLLRFVLVTMREIRKVQKRVKLEKAAKSEAADVEKQQQQDATAEAGSSSTPQFEIRVPAVQPTTLYGDGIKPAVRQVPLLLKAMVKTLIAALGPRGVGAACAFTMASTAVLDIALIDALKRAGIGADPNAPRRGRLAAFSTFASAALASSTALYMLQRASVGADHDALKTNLSIGNPFRRKNVNGEPGMGRGVPTPLAPGGHFLARMTTLSIPTTPRNEKGSRSPAEKTVPLPALSPTQEKPGKVPGAQEIGTASPTIDLSLFALVRAMDTLARALPFVLAIQRQPYTPRCGSGPIGPAGGMKTSTSRNQLGIGASRNLIVRALQNVGGVLEDQAHGLAFVVACAIIMFNWFYHPERLPPTYVRWISNLASMDHRALQALRCLRYQKPYRYQYGDKGMDPEGINVLGSLSESLGHPYSWGDVSRLPTTRAEAQSQKRQGSKEAIAAAQAAGKPLPEPFILEGAVGPRGRGEMGGVPCEVIHCGIGGGNCYKNALYRFLRAWRMCLGIYVPVHLLPRLIFGPGQFKRQPVETITKVLVGSARSATFLSTFIASIWFMVCLGRSILLPRLFPSVSFRFWDQGLGPIMGSWTCGWSVFIEEPRKRAEMALYVAPRALFALAEMSRPGWLSRGKKSALQAERLLFGMSVGIVVAAARHRPDLLRGITALMAWIVAPTKAAAGAKRVKAAAPRT